MREPGWRLVLSRDTRWDEALDLTATTLRNLADTYGPETVAFSITTPAGTSISDAKTWIDRLQQTFGSPNNCNALELCGWHRLAAGHELAVAFAQPYLRLPADVLDRFGWRFEPQWSPPW